jgi:hypothetical protein
MLQSEQGPMQVLDDGRSWPNITEERVKRYLELMRAIPAIEVSRREAAPGAPSYAPRLVIVLWGSGFAGDTVHSGVCWTADNPTRQIASVDAFIRNPKSSAGTGWVFEPIEDKWYLWTDLRTGQSL